jgi:phosphatidylserine/phosphatidylglycerophosphate/cardiolipin synthase-like enzyme
MKRLCFVVMCAMLNLSGMHFIQRIPKRFQLCFNNVPSNFGTTHFIRGYACKKDINPYFEKKNVVSYIEPIINGSSVHLLDESRSVQSFFPSVHNVLSIIIHILSQAKKSIYIAAFALTDNRISKELIEAHKKGIDVSVIMDASNVKQPYSKGQMLVDNKISVKCYDPTLRDNYKKKQFTPLMHRKCCIVDRKIVITGSTNFTRAAENNAEDINVIRCKDTVYEQITEYERMDKCSTILHPR